MTRRTATTDHRLHRGLGNRQMTMIALGGVIGAGLFVGSGTTIRAAGPAVVLTYAAMGMLVFMVMRMLAEMAVANPSTGSFADYAHRDIGPWAGFSVGWLYVYKRSLTNAFEAVAGAAIIHSLVPPVPAWLAALACILAMLAVNIASVRSYGEFEFWFSTIKVTAIIAFIALGVVAFCGGVPSFDTPGLSNLTSHGGFFPQGWSGVVFAAPAVLFSYFGTEIAAIAGGEAKDPVRTVRKAMNSVIFRLLVFYIGSILVVVTLLPWNSSQVTDSPYSAVLTQLGIPAAGVVMSLIVLTAVLSCLNSSMYAASRMLYGLAEQHQAPKHYLGTNRRGAPVLAVFTTSIIGLLAIAANYFFPSTVVFGFLLNSASMISIVVYLWIVVTQLRSRYRACREGATLSVRMWGFPYITIAVAFALIAIVVAMGFNPSSRPALWAGLAVTAITILCGVLWQSYTKHRPDTRPSRSETRESQPEGL